MVKHTNNYDEALWGEIGSVHAKLIEPRFAVKDFDVQPQYINHWRKQDLFFTGGETDGRKLFSFVDYVWIRMIEKMKDIGLRFEIIRKVRDNLEAKSIWLERTDKNYDELIAGARKNNATEKQIKELEETKKTLYYLENLQTFFSKHLTGAVVYRKELSFLINPEGQVLHKVKESIRDQYTEHKFLDSFKSFYFSISVTDIIQEFIEGEKRHVATEDLQLITKEEETLLKQLEGGELVKLMIEVKGVMTNLFEGKHKEEKEPKEVKQEYLDIITSQPYEQITFQNNRGTETKFLSPKQIMLLNKLEEKLGMNE